MKKVILRIVLFTAVTALIVACASHPNPQGKESLPVADSVVFDANGYYLPAEEVTIKGYKLEWFELHTLDYYDEESRHEKPRSVPPEAWLRLVESSTDSFHSYPCIHPFINRDTIDLYCPTTPLGPVRIRGSFVDRRGQFWNKEDVSDSEKVVVTARVFVEEQGKEILIGEIKFTYSGGD